MEKHKENGFQSNKVSYGFLGEVSTPATDINDRPLVTFALLAYNQELFIRDAIQGAFSQTYSPLEIVLSDDYSQDNTFEIMKEMVSKYFGPHTIILNRNERNRGLTDHINAVMEISKGRLIVVAAGDDISLPYRTEITYNNWIWSKKCNYSIFTNMLVIDARGDVQGQFKSPDLIPVFDLEKAALGGLYVYGCTHAWDRSIFDLFGPLQQGITYEDHLIPFRSLLLGSIGYINTPTVLYRRHGSNLWKDKGELRSYAHFNHNLLSGKEDNVKILECWISDLSIAAQNGIIDPQKHAKLNGIITRRINDEQIALKLLSSTFLERLILLKKLVRNHAYSPWKYFVLFPRFLFPYVYFFLSKYNFIKPILKFIATIVNRKHAQCEQWVARTPNDS